MIRPVPMGYVDRRPLSPGYRRRLPVWVNWPLFGILALVPVALAVVVPPEHLLGTVLAYANLMLIGGASIYFACQGTLQGLIPVLFLAWLAAAWPLASIYFAIQSPDLVYKALAAERPFLLGNVRLQLVTMAFLVPYLSTLFLFAGRPKPWKNAAVFVRTDRRVAAIALAIAAAAITFNAVSKVRPLPGILQYLADGGYHYLHGLTLVVGVLFTSLTFPTRAMAAGFLVAAGTFYSVGNARGLAALPIAIFLTGLIFLSDLNRRWKIWIVTGALVCFPLALVVSNTTRIVTKTIGFSDLDTRLHALNNWRDVLSETSLLTSTFGRLFFAGGHTIIVLSPEHYPYVDLSIERYLIEFFMRMLPKRFFGDLYYSEQPNRILRGYGFLITEETSIPLSLPGSLYMLGGVLPVVLGGIAIGLVHIGLGGCLRAAGRRSRYLPLFVFAMCAPDFVWGQNFDPITHTRSLVWSGVSAWALYQLFLRPLIGEPLPGRRTAPPRRLVRPAA